MQKIALLTDSASDLTKDIIEKYNIKTAPFRIIYKDKEYEDSITITPEEVYERLAEEIPSTSLPNVERIETILNQLEDEGYTHVISINIASNLSGTSNSIRLILEQHPKLKYHVFDTKTLTMAEGALVLEAGKMIEEGKSFDEIISTLPKLREKLHVFFTLNTLEYLKKGGRIGKVAGTIGEFLNLKPLITVNDEGIYETYAKLRGRKQSIKKLLEVLDGYLEKGNCNLWLIDGDAKEESTDLYNKIKDNPKIKCINHQTLGPALGVHTGPGLIGFVIQEI